MVFIHGISRDLGQDLNRSLHSSVEMRESSLAQVLQAVASALCCIGRCYVLTRSCEAGAKRLEHISEAATPLIVLDLGCSSSAPTRRREPYGWLHSRQELPLPS